MNSYNGNISAPFTYYLRIDLKEWGQRVQVDKDWKDCSVSDITLEGEKQFDGFMNDVGRRLCGLFWRIISILIEISVLLEFKEVLIIFYTKLKLTKPASVIISNTTKGLIYKRNAKCNMKKMKTACIK